MKKNSIESKLIIKITVFIVTLTMMINIGNIVKSLDTKSISITDNINIYNRNNSYLFPPKKTNNINQNNGLRSLYFNIQNEPIMKKQDILQNDNGPINSPWPMHGHDIYHTGRSPYNTINTTGVEKWRFNAQDLVDGSAIVDNNGIIYFGAMDNFYALYPNGTMKWHTVFGSSIAMFGTSPAIDENGMIYVPTMSGLVAIFSNNGTTKWAFGGDVESSPVIGSDGTIYFGQTSGSTGYVNAIYPNGTIRWRYHTGHVVYSSPAIGLDGTVYCGSHDGNLYAFYPENGTVKWAFPTGNWVHGSPTVGSDGAIYIGSDDTYLYALFPNGTMKWRIGVGSMRTSPSLDKWGTLYFGVWESTFWAIYPNGTMKWSYNLGTGNGVWGSTAAISDDGTIYFGICVDINNAGGGDLVTLNIDGTEKWSKRIANEYVTSSPCIAKDGTVYIGSSWIAGNGYFHAFGPGEPKQINIQEPKTGHFYLFDHDMGTTLGNSTIVIGSVTIKVDVSSIQDIESVDFYVGYYAAENPVVQLKFSDTEPPFEWKLNEYIGNNHHPFLPFDKCCIQIVGRYKGGCIWTDEIPKFWYFHLLNN